MVDRGCDVTLVVPDDGFVNELKQMFPSVKIEIVPLRRKISPVRDLRVLLSLYRLFRKRQFDIIHLHTPKASLLGVLAARLAGHKRIIFHLHGLALQLGH